VVAFCFLIMKKEDVKVKKDPMYSQLDSFLDDKSNDIRKLSKGDVVEGTILDTRPGAIVVDVGYKSEGVVAGKELKSELIDVSKLKVNDKILVYVVKPEDEEGQLVLSVRRTQQAGLWISLGKAKEDNEIVEAVVVESNNGGLICELGSGVRGFIPTSQLDPARVYSNGLRQVGQDVSNKVSKKLASLVGEKIKTRIIELDKEKNRIILSEKMITQTRDIEKREKTLKSLQEGAVLKGEVSGITPFGIFVNAEGLEGLVHLSELSWDKIDDVDKMYKVGDKVDVMVIGVTDGGKRVAYSIKRLQKDPWMEAISKYKVGDVVKGEVQRVADYGAFVKIGKGLNGLVHISEISDKLVKDPRDFVSVGQEVEVKILSISSTERHLGLSLKWKEQESKPAKKVQPVKVEKPTKKVSAEELAKVVDEAIDKELE
jgi:small subunit ribosomal protein S1